MQQRVDVDVEWDAGTTAVKDFDGEVETTHAGPEHEDASVRTPMTSTKSSPTRARTEAFGSAAILRSPALGTAPSRVVPKPPEDADATPEPVKAKEWSAPTEASPLAKARRASAQRAAASAELPLAAPEPSVLAPLAPAAPRESPQVAFDAPLPTLRIEKISGGSTLRTILAAVVLVVVASGAYAVGRKYQSRPQPAAAATPSTKEVTKVVMPTVEAPPPVETALTPAVSQPEVKPAKSVAAVQAKPARQVTKKKALRPKAKTRAVKTTATSSPCTALDCL